MEDSISRFKQTLDEYHSWPCTYTFKFIVPAGQCNEVLNLFEHRDEVSTRNSRNGKYVSITAKCQVHSSDEVVTVYEAASHIEGVLSL
jgi:hypothetical protein